MPREALRQLQLVRLQETLARVTERVPFYERLFKERGIEAGDIRSLDDLRRLPFTTKQDLRDNYPFGFFAEPLSEVVRIHASSGTTGKPTPIGYTSKDIQTWAGLVARIIAAAGVTQEDVAQVSFGYGLFTGGLGLHYGLEKIGCAIVPVASGNTPRQLLVMQDFATTVLVCTPSYALYLGEMVREQGLKGKIKLRRGLFGAEPWSEGVRQRIEEDLGILAYDNYGLSEIIGPGVSGECQERQGLHINEDHFLPEVIDPDSGEVLEDGERGELVFTTLTKEAFPLIRYRTRDIAVLDPEPCPCGRTSVRHSRVTGRTDDMLIIRGVNVYPSQIEHVLTKIQGVEPHYQLIVTREGALDNLEVQVELNSSLYEQGATSRLAQRIGEELRAVLGLRAQVSIVAPGTIARSEGKARRVIDKRQLVAESR
ncbi:MAG: phenylacetate--CoA ligase [Chloroflexi bacterium]|nr:phenylacetate--CoA ligase [Chloroflexota bacterium]